MNAIIAFENVTAGYGRTRVLEGLSLEVPEGIVCGVIGPNGSGKTTMLNVIAGEIRPSAGRVLLAGRDITRLSPEERCCRGIGRTSQIPRPFQRMTVYENALVGAMFGAGRREPEARKLALSALKRTGLVDRRAVPAGSLTLLDRKRLEIARALATEPKLMLLDEVAAGLTSAETGEIMALVAELKAEGLSVIWIEHIVETMVRATDHLICLAEGRCAARGRPEEVMRSGEVERLYLGVETDG